VGLDLEFEFESRATDVIFGRFFENTCNALVDSFTQRAAKIYAR
jgi:ribosome-associated toxin RatA of RatAB toxin-antitoxin module